jgi:hypothetical protein
MELYMKKTLFENRFYKDRIPTWTCPVCNTGIIKLQQNSWYHQETAESKRDYADEDWEPDWIRYIFSCTFICNNDLCQEPVSCCGIGHVEDEQYIDDSNRWCREHNDVFSPKFFQPSLRFIEIPSNCPSDVYECLQKSFSLYFTDANASLNCARMAIECILDNLEADKKSGQSLHKRIISLPDKHNELKELLLAAKWLGNSGSHAGDTCTSKDVHVAYELLEFIINEIYDNKKERLSDIAKKVNEQKGRIK